MGETNFLVDQPMEEDIDIDGGMDESLFTTEELEEMDIEARLRTLTLDKDSIKKTSEALISKVDQSEDKQATTKRIVQMWARYILRVTREQKVVFTYLANDLIHRTSPKKRSEGQWFFTAMAPPVISDILIQMIDILNREFNATSPQPGLRLKAKETNQINEKVLEVI
jgi:hypothetical protein